MTTIDYQDGGAVCPKCKGMLSYDARVTQKLPVGLGFVGSKFQIDFIKRQGWRGECMDCGVKVFAVQSQKHVSKVPRSINRKLKALEAA